MARYEPTRYGQLKMIPVSFEEQILPGSFEYTLSRLIDEEVSCRQFDRKYKNDTTGDTACNPRVLLKIILYAYSKGILSSRGIAWACRNNVMFMALSADTQPHFTTIAEFIPSSSQQIAQLFRDILLICDEKGLIGKQMFATARCVVCHRLGEEGGVSGPDLTGVGRRFAGRDLLASILDPSAVVAEKYSNTLFELSDGRVLSGLEALIPRIATVHSIWSWRDPYPALARARMMLSKVR